MVRPIGNDNIKLPCLESIPSQKFSIEAGTLLTSPPETIPYHQKNIVTEHLHRLLTHLFGGRGCRNSLQHALGSLRFLEAAVAQKLYPYTRLPVEYLLLYQFPLRQTLLFCRALWVSWRGEKKVD
jgi:hypothetical protein